jgi:hypothetical protein
LAPAKIAETDVSVKTFPMLCASTSDAVSISIFVAPAVCGTVSVTTIVSISLAARRAAASPLKTPWVAQAKTREARRHDE